MPKSTATVSTAHASRYLQQLCKHWAHRFETEWTPTNGRIALPLGQTVLAASDDALAIEIAAPKGDDLDGLRTVVQTHVERFAFRETLHFAWRDEDAA